MEGEPGVVVEPGCFVAPRRVERPGKAKETLVE
jgi:hypothetical protein